MSTHQAGIFQEGTRHHIFLEFAIPNAPRVLPRRAPVTIPVDAGHQVVAFGPALVEALEGVGAPSGDFGFAALDGLDGMGAPATQRDLFVWLHGDRRDELFARALNGATRLRALAKSRTRTTASCFGIAGT